MRDWYSGGQNALAGFGSHLHILVLLTHPPVHVRVIKYLLPLSRFKTISADDPNYSHFSYVPIRKGLPLSKGNADTECTDVGGVCVSFSWLQKTLDQPLGSH